MLVVAVVNNINILFYNNLQRILTTEMILPPKYLCLVWNGRPFEQIKSALICL